MKCKHCGSHRTKKNGSDTRWRSGTRYKVQRYQCNDCGRTTMGEYRRAG